MVRKSMDVTMAVIQKQHLKTKEEGVRLDKLVDAYFYPGREVSYLRGRGTVTVTVIMTNNFGDVKVLGKNGKEYWFHYYRFLNAGNI